MNVMDSLFAVTRLTWSQCRENPEALGLFKKSQSFKFPLLETFCLDSLLQDITLPLNSSQPLPHNLLLYIFGPKVQEKDIPPEWIHHIFAPLNLLVGKKSCLCCNVKFLPTSAHYQ